MAIKNGELKKLIRHKYGTESKCAKEMGWTRQRLNKITNGNKEPTISELNTIARCLNMDVGELSQFFLKQLSPNG